MLPVVLQVASSSQMRYWIWILPQVHSFHLENISDLRAFMVQHDRMKQTLNIENQYKAEACTLSMSIFHYQLAFFAKKS